MKKRELESAMPNKTHKNKVNAIIRFFEEHYRTEKGTKWVVEIDHEVKSELPPLLIKGHRPDFAAQLWSPHTIILGEAKSQGDFNAGSRSQFQVSTFIQQLFDLQNHPTQPYHTGLILCVAISDLFDARYFISKEERVHSVRIHLIDETGFEHRHAYSHKKTGP